VFLVAAIGLDAVGSARLSFAVPALADPPSMPGPAGAPPPRETQQPSAQTFLARGLLDVARPTPEDQAEGQRLLRKALGADAGLAAAHVGLARSAIYLHAAGIDERAEILQAALTEARAAVESAPDSAATHAVMALAFALSDRLTPARGEADRAIAVDPASFEGHLAQCVVLRLRRDLEAAVEACRRAAARAPDEPRVLMGLGEALREAGDAQGAMDMFGQATDLDHESILPRLGAAAVLVRSGQIRIAAVVYDTLLEEAPWARTRILESAAGMRISRSDWEGALELYDRITLPENGSLPTLLALYGKGYALLQLDRAAEAEYFLSLLIDRAPAPYDGPARGREVLFRAYGDLVDYFASKGRSDRVEALLRGAVTRDGAPTRLARRLGDLLTGKGGATEAASLLDHALRTADPEEDPLEIGDTALLLARVRHDGGRPSGRARAETSRTLAFAYDRVPESAPGAAHYRLARAFALSGDAEKSLECLKRARLSGYLPPEAAAEPDLAIVRSLPAFQKLVTP
jgi:tetratricopeptide (TPR) repeat protein